MTFAFFQIKGIFAGGKVTPVALAPWSWHDTHATVHNFHLFFTLFEPFLPL